MKIWLCFVKLLALGVLIGSASCGGGGGLGFGKGITVFVGRPATSEDAQMIGSQGEMQVGAGQSQVSGFGTTGVGYIWQGDPQTAKVIHKPEFILLHLLNTDGTRQVGRAAKEYGLAANDPYHAILLTGTADSLIDLHPAEYFATAAWDLEGNTQVGLGKRTAADANHPLLWTGSAQSIVDLLPPNANSGTLRAIKNGIQGGSIVLTGETLSRAALWHGSVGTYEDIHPAGYQSSGVRAMSDTDIVGGGVPNDGVVLGNGFRESHALRWVKDQVIDLHPSSVFSSGALDTDGRIQVGHYFSEDASDLGRACMWKGTAGSFVDLHQFLPSQYVGSWATSISGKTICGWAYDPSHNFYGVIWRMP